MMFSLFIAVASGCTSKEELMAFDNVLTAKNTCEWDANCVFIHNQEDFENQKRNCKSRNGECNNEKGMQCGGHTFLGQTCCPSETECYRRDHQYSECKKKCPADWECNDTDETPSEPEYHCVGEIESFNARCEFDNQEDCERAGRNAISDGFCDWVAMDEDTSGSEDPCECMDSFYWKGTQYDECTVTEDDGLSWCYVKGGAACTEATESTKNEGMFYINNCGHDCDCKEFFLFQGTAYTECTDADDTTPWCYVKGYDTCEYATQSTINTGEYYRYCASDTGCPSQMKIDELPAMSARTVCEDAGCVYSTDTSDGFNTVRSCSPMVCPSQAEIDSLPAMSARTRCEEMGCVYSTDTSNPFQTVRMCNKETPCTDADTLAELPAFSARNMCEANPNCVYKIDQSNPFETIRSCEKRTRACMNAEEDQCGGEFFTGATCCPEGLMCYERDVTYSACKAECPSDAEPAWDCDTSGGEDDCPSAERIASLPAMSARTVCEDAGCVYSTDTSDPFNTVRSCFKTSPCMIEDLDDLPAMSAKNACEASGECVYKMNQDDPFNTVRSCVRKTSECMNAEEDQCGGEMGFMGQTCCPEGFECTARDFTYSACKAECPVGADPRWECEDNMPTMCEGDKDKYAKKLFNFDLSGVNDCLSAVKFLELQGGELEGCDIPLANYAAFGLLNMDPKYSTLREMCCESCALPSVCTLDADSYISETGLCERGEESFTLYCNEVNCIENPECSFEDFGLDMEDYDCDACLMEDKIWTGSVVKKSASSAMKCYEKCLNNVGMKEGKTCKAYSYLEGARKSCRLYPKNKSTKSKEYVLSGKRNCHPQKGRIKK